MTINDQFTARQEYSHETRVSDLGEQMVKHQPISEDQLKFNAHSKGVFMELLYEDTRNKHKRCCEQLESAFKNSMLVTTLVFLAGIIFLLATRQFTIYNVVLNVAIGLFLGLSIFLVLRIVFTEKRKESSRYLWKADIDSNIATLKPQLSLTVVEAGISLWVAKIKLVFKK